MIALSLKGKKGRILFPSSKETNRKWSCIMYLSSSIFEATQLGEKRVYTQCYTQNIVRVQQPEFLQDTEKETSSPFKE